MKRSHRCPKCEGTRLWRIENFRHQTDVVAGSELVVAILDRDRVWTGATVRGTFDMYLCATCGYSELWANGLDELYAKPEEGVHLLEGDEPKPYR